MFPDGIPSGAVAAKTPATSTARGADYLLDDNYLFGQNMTEYNPAPSPSGHPLLSGPPTLIDIHQIFTQVRSLSSGPRRGGLGRVLSVVARAVFRDMVCTTQS